MKKDEMVMLVKISPKFFPYGKAMPSVEIASFDYVFIENFVPGTVDRMEFGYDKVSRMNPRLFYC